MSEDVVYKVGDKVEIVATKEEMRKVLYYHGRYSKGDVATIASISSDPEEMNCMLEGDTGGACCIELKPKYLKVIDKVTEDKLPPVRDNLKDFEKAALGGKHQKLKELETLTHSGAMSKLIHEKVQEEVGKLLKDLYIELGTDSDGDIEVKLCTSEGTITSSYLSTHELDTAISRTVVN
jgi:hypothetical protein